MVTYSEFGQLLTVARKSRGLSRLEIAVAVCVDPSFYARVERGLRMVSLITFALLWRHLALDAGPLLAALPVEVAEPNKRQRQRTRPGKASPAELAYLLNDSIASWRGPGTPLDSHRRSWPVRLDCPVGISDASRAAMDCHRFRRLRACIACSALTRIGRSGV